MIDTATHRKNLLARVDRLSNRFHRDHEELKGLRQRVLEYDGSPRRPAQDNSEGVEQILAFAVKTLGYSRDTLMSRSKDRSVCWARFVTVQWLHTYTKLNNIQVGRIFGRVPGFTLHALRAMNNRIATEPKYADYYNELTNRMIAERKTL